MILYFTESLIKTITRVFRARNIAGRLASTSTTAISRNHARRLKRIAVKQNGKHREKYKRLPVRILAYKYRGYLWLFVFSYGLFFQCALVVQQTNAVALSVAGSFSHFCFLQSSEELRYCFWEKSAVDEIAPCV